MIRVDATLPIRPGMAVWPGDGGVVFTRTSSMADGDSCNVTRLDMGVHTGTHVDAPSHFIAAGQSVDAMDLDVLIGAAFVLDLPDVRDSVTAEDLAAAPECERLILRTANTARSLLSSAAFCEDFTHISRPAAAAIAERGIRLVGVDYLSVEGFRSGSHAVHDTLLGAGIVLVEGLDLRDVSGGWWWMACVPLKLEGADGSPARVIFERDA